MREVELPDTSASGATEGDLLNESRYVDLAIPIAKLLSSSAPYRDHFAETRIFLVNSTAAGGGVAEMLPRLVRLLRGFGITARWFVFEPPPDLAQPFWRITKALHNGIHGASIVGDPALFDGSSGDWLSTGFEALPPEAKEGIPDDALPIEKMKAIYDYANKKEAEAFRKVLAEDAAASSGKDRIPAVLIVHDPQPAGIAWHLKAAGIASSELKTIWRCHIGLEIVNAPTKAAWSFLGEGKERGYLQCYDACVFSVKEYVRPFVAHKSFIIRPGISPLSAKNRDLSPFEIVSVLHRAGLIATSAEEEETALDPPFAHRAVVFDPRSAPLRRPSDRSGLVIKLPPAAGSSPIRPKTSIAAFGRSPRERAERLLKEELSEKDETAVLEDEQVEREKALLFSSSPASEAASLSSSRGPSLSVSLVEGTSLSRASPLPGSPDRAASQKDVLPSPSSPPVLLPGFNGEGKKILLPLPQPQGRPFNIPAAAPELCQGETKEAKEASAATVPVVEAQSIGLLRKPMVLQVSRWDRLKGWHALLRAWAQLKLNIEFYCKGGGSDLLLPVDVSPHQTTTQRAIDPLKKGQPCSSERNEDRHRKMLQQAILVMAGPEPSAIADDPEGLEVLLSLQEQIRLLPPVVQSSVKMLLLPMSNREENALMCNALQRCATVVIQASSQEGFGLTLTEALFKGVATIGTAQACGLRSQIRHGVDGLLVQGNASNPLNIATALNSLLGNDCLRANLAVNGKKRATLNFLSYSQLSSWVDLLYVKLLSPYFPSSKAGPRKMRQRLASPSPARGMGAAARETKSANDVFAPSSAMQRQKRKEKANAEVRAVVSTDDNNEDEDADEDLNEILRAAEEAERYEEEQKKATAEAHKAAGIVPPSTPARLKHAVRQLVDFSKGRIAKEEERAGTGLQQEELALPSPAAAAAAASPPPPPPFHGHRAGRSTFASVVEQVLAGQRALRELHHSCSGPCGSGHGDIRAKSLSLLGAMQSEESNSRPSRSRQAMRIVAAMDQGDEVAPEEHQAAAPRTLKTDVLSESQAATTITTTSNTTATGRFQHDRTRTATGRFQHDRTRTAMTVPEIRQELAKDQQRKEEARVKKEAKEGQLPRGAGQPPFVAEEEEEGR